MCLYFLALGQVGCLIDEKLFSWPELVKTNTFSGTLLSVVDLMDKVIAWFISSADDESIMFPVCIRTSVINGS